VLDKMAKKVQSGAKAQLHEIWMSPTREDAQEAFAHFVSTYEAKYPSAVACLKKDREVLLTFYDFPAEHWIHLRTTNPIESTFATVRLRHRRTKGNGSRVACLAMVFKLCESAERHWRSLNGAKLLPEVIAGAEFVNGENPGNGPQESHLPIGLAQRVELELQLRQAAATSYCQMSLMAP